jgi:hypothetical protein
MKKGLQAMRAGAPSPVGWQVLLIIIYLTKFSCKFFLKGGEQSDCLGLMTALGAFEFSGHRFERARGVLPLFARPCL